MNNSFKIKARISGPLFLSEKIPVSPLTTVHVSNKHVPKFLQLPYTYYTILKTK